MSQAVLDNSKPASKQRVIADSLSKSVLLIGCLMVIQRGIGFVRSFYVCGVLSPAEVGQWDLAFSFLMLVAPLAVIGIPGSFGRYVAHYEKKDQHTRLLKHTFVVCLALTLIASGAIYLLRIEIAKWMLGDETQSHVVSLLACGLPLVVFFNFSTSWFVGQRLNRIVFRIQFAQTLFFAVLCVFTLKIFSISAVSIILAYLISCLFGLLLAASYFVLIRPSSGSSTREESNAEPPTLAPIWQKILPFAIWVWVSNALINLFSVCDRLLLVNFYPDSGVDVQSLVGQYHTSRIFPLLLLAVGAMAGSMITPYLSKDWEAGKRESVAGRLNLFLKSIGICCIAAAIGIMTLAPILFGGLWQDKFVLGESLLPLTLSYCSLAAMTLIAQKYFWCIEKTWYSGIVLFVGVLVNICLGLSLIEPFGIEGVVVATLISHAIVLAGVLILCRKNGMSIDIGVLIIVAALVAICFGKWIACAGGAMLLIAIVFSRLIFDESEKHFAIKKFKSQLARFSGATT